MNTKNIKPIFAIALIFAATVPVDARGFRGGGGFGGRDDFGGGRGYGGDRNFGGGDRSFGGDHSFGNDQRNFDHDFDQGGFSGNRGNFTSGPYNRPAGGGAAGGFGANHPNAGSGGFSNNHPNAGNGTFANNHPEAGNGSLNNNNHPLGSDGGWGAAGGSVNRYSSEHNAFEGNKLNTQGDAVRNSFNGGTTVNNFNHTDVNAYHNTNVNGYHNNNLNGYHDYNGYHNGAYGYHNGYGYNHGYYGNHFYGYPGGWNNAGFMEATMWTFMGVTSLETFLGMAALSSSKNSNKQQQPAATTNITYTGDNIFINGMPSASYYSQAQTLAMSGNAVDVYNGGQSIILPGSSNTVAAPVKKEKWESLGVYSLVEPGQTESTTIFQLAINKAGTVRGNYTNQITNERAQVMGAVDKKTGQISWYVGNNPTTVFETTLAQLGNQDSTVVVQFGANQTHQMGLIRLPQPKNT